MFSWVTFLTILAIPFSMFIIDVPTVASTWPDVCMRLLSLCRLPSTLSVYMNFGVVLRVVGSDSGVLVGVVGGRLSPATISAQISSIWRSCLARCSMSELVIRLPRFSKVHSSERCLLPD
jgi:hypothetical protein